MYQSLGVLLLVAFCQAAQIMRLNGQMPSMGRSKRDISLAVSGSCVVTGNQLFANDFAVRQLNDTEQEMMQQYQQDLQEYKSTRQELQAQLQNVTMRRIRGQQLTQDEQEALQQLRDLDPPSAPAFCSGDDTTLYIFDGCMVQDNKVYVGNTYARDLTSDETQQLQNFLQQIDAYMQYKQNQFDQKMSQFASNMQSMFGGFGSNENQDDVEMSTTTTPESDNGPSLFPSPPFPSSSPSSSPSPSISPPPTFPTPPQLCYSF